MQNATHFADFCPFIGFYTVYFDEVCNLTGNLILWLKMLHIFYPFIGELRAEKEVYIHKTSTSDWKNIPYIKAEKRRVFGGNPVLFNTVRTEAEKTGFFPWHGPVNFKLRKHFFFTKLTHLNGDCVITSFWHNTVSTFSLRMACYYSIYEIKNWNNNFIL